MSDQNNGILKFGPEFLHLNSLFSYVILGIK